MLDILEDPAAAPALAFRAPAAQQHAKSARILVVDDELANLRELALMLRSEGYERVELVQDSREVLGRYCSERPDLILLDSHMPHLDGHAVMQQLAAIGDSAAPPVLVLSEQASDEALLRALTSGATDVLSKPFRRRELLARVHTVLLAHLADRLLHEHRQQLQQRVHAGTQALRLSRLELARRLGRASEFRDDASGHHILRMSQASALLARRLGWDAEACELMLNASALHDVGKIGIPDGILLKPGPLTPEERRIMQTHTLIGAQLLGDSGDELFGMACDIAHAHHERWDGQGYPRGLAGSAIPEAARIVAITDVFDALTSVRPYKPAWAIADALAFMADSAGTLFDPWLVQSFIPLKSELEALRERFPDAPPADAAAPDLLEQR